MKSIVTLLVLVAVAYAGIVKDGGLKGSWQDELEFTGTNFDTTAPQIIYDDSVTSAWSDNNINITGTYDWTYFYFAIDGEADDFYLYGGVDVTIWAGDDMENPDNTLPAACTLYSDNTVTCYVSITAHSGQYMYKPYIMAWDIAGNWASADETDFTDTDNVATLTVYDHTMDATAPVIGTVTVTGADVTLGDGDDYNDFAYVTISTTVNDFEDSTADDYDPLASGVMGVWAVIGVSDDEDEDMTVALIMEEEVDDTEVYTYAIQLAFAPYAEEGTWNVRRVTAVDYAGNWATDKPSDTDITITFDNDDDVTACQTLEIVEASSYLDMADSVYSYAYASLLLTCTEKYDGYNYGYVSYMSPEYLADGDTEKSTQVSGSYGYVGLNMQWQSIDVDTTATSYAPGQLMASGLSAHGIIVREGQVDDTVDSWTLYEVITFTGSGAVQRYTADLGSASAVVPSAFAVAIAAVVAMLRL